MVDYTAGQARYTRNDARPAAFQSPAIPANSVRARTHTATGESAGMNITTGGPHILLFERDQQFVALLTSELQLAGYECHAARTAVEVFDAIARFPIMLVLVNLAQAAAARREFWVALDTQRRGRGVQVLTFHCTNLAGYGPASDDAEERSHTALADIEVDGMVGVMNMVNAIRGRIAVTNTGSVSRVASSANTVSAFGTQATAPIPSITPDIGSQPPKGTASASAPAAPASPIPQQDLPRQSSPGHTDKIRAVIYPNQRSWSTPGTRDTNAGHGQSSSAKELPAQGDQQHLPQSAPPPAVLPTPLVDAFNNGQKRPISEAGLPKESGLAQLS